MKKLKETRSKIFSHEGNNPLYKFEAFIINRFGRATAGFLGHICGLILGSAVFIGLLLIALEIYT